MISSRQRSVIGAGSSKDPAQIEEAVKKTADLNINFLYQNEDPSTAASLKQIVPKAMIYIKDAEFSKRFDYLLQLLCQKDKDTMSKKVSYTYTTFFKILSI